MTLGDKQESSPVWSPDGSRIAFASYSTGQLPDIVEKPSSGVGKDETLFHSGTANFPVDWSGDGRFLLFESRGSAVNTKLWVLPLSGDRKAFPLLQTPFNESLGAFSPDGRWIAYVSDESGRPEVYVQTFPISTSKWRVSTSGGTQPRWRSDGKEIFYVASNSKLMAVPVSAGSSFEAGIPTALFDVVAIPGVSLRRQYCVASGGERFLVARGMESQETRLRSDLELTADLKK